MHFVFSPIMLICLIVPDHSTVEVQIMNDLRQIDKKFEAVVGNKHKRRKSMVERCERALRIKLVVP